MHDGDGTPAAAGGARSGKLRLALTSYYLPSESKIGAGFMAHRLANALVDGGHDVTMFSPSRRCHDARYVHVHRPVDGRWRTLRWPLTVRRLDLSGFDALIAQGDDHLVAGGRWPGLAHVRTMHGSCLDEALHVRGTRERLRMVVLGLTEVVSALRTPTVVGVSANAVRMYPWVRTVVPNGVDTELFAPAVGDGDGAREVEPTVLFVGTYGGRKRGELLQRAFTEHVRGRLPNARLWMVCSDAPSAPGVEVLGRVSDAELADRYRRAWLFCLPSSYEGFGVPYAEALVSGCPVVATPNPGAREVLEGGRLGVLTSEVELGPELVRLLGDGDRRAALSRLGVARRDRYSLASVAQRYVDLVTAQLASVGSSPVPVTTPAGESVSNRRPAAGR